MIISVRLFNSLYEIYLLCFFVPCRLTSFLRNSIQSRSAACKLYTTWSVAADAPTHNTRGLCCCHQTSGATSHQDSTVSCCKTTRRSQQLNYRQHYCIKEIWYSLLLIMFHMAGVVFSDTFVNLGCYFSICTFLHCYSTNFPFLCSFCMYSILNKTFSLFLLAKPCELDANNHMAMGLSTCQHTGTVQTPVKWNAPAQEQEAIMYFYIQMLKPG